MLLRAGGSGYAALERGRERPGSQAIMPTWRASCKTRRGLHWRQTNDVYPSGVPMVSPIRCTGWRWWRWAWHYRQSGFRPGGGAGKRLNRYEFLFSAASADRTGNGFAAESMAISEPKELNLLYPDTGSRKSASVWA